MELKEKLDLLVDLPKKERAKAEAKFMAALALTSEKEISDVLAYLRTKNVVIKDAKAIKVLANGVEELTKKFSILEEIHATDIYEDANRLNYNALDIYKKIKYCIQTGIAYKKEDGSYEQFLFDEAMWLDVFNRKPEQKEEGIVTFEPVVEEPTLEVVSDVDTKYRDITDIQIESVPESTNFAQVKAELESALTELGTIKDELSNANLEEINFADLEPDIFGGRAA